MPKDNNFPLNAGAASADITPDLPFLNWVTQEVYPGLLDPLSAQALATECGGEQALVISMDLLEIHRNFAATIRHTLQERLGIPAGNILLNASHTHSGPRCPFLPEELSPAQTIKMNRFLDDPAYTAWSRNLVEKLIDCANRAMDARRPARVGIRRIHAGDWVYNRRPIQPDGLVTTDFSPRDSQIQPGGRRFGPGDPTLTAVRFFDSEGQTLSTLLHFACHSVAIYPTDKRISADWPGLLRQKLLDAEGGIPQLLQGCAGDQVPVRRGLTAAREMTDALADRLLRARTTEAEFPAAPPRTASETLSLPLAQPEPGRKSMPAEVQVLTLGPLALVALPGEPLIGLALEILNRSPFPHTLCLGYSNGHGTAYVPLPEDKARGGYEAQPNVSPGTPECGRLLVESACRLLDSLNPRPRPGAQ